MFSLHCILQAILDSKEIVEGSIMPRHDGQMILFPMRTIYSASYPSIAATPGRSSQRDAVDERQADQLYDS